ncbi:MAG: NAD-dependent deacylase [bacterium]|nr:NAD-dependent deacylase [bacterium]
MADQAGAASGMPESFIEAVRSAKSVAVLTGAGVSAESGVPTFRDAQTGLWARYDPQQLATPEAFRANPELVWEWYRWRRELVSKAQPNPGHFALAAIEEKVSDFTLITQNVDSLHRLAGSNNVVEVHGNIMKTCCFDCSADAEEEDASKAEVKVPRCQLCGGMLRPGVVWFGESLVADVLRTATEASQRCDVFFSIGTSSAVYPAAALPFEALTHGAMVIEINPDKTPFTPRATYSIQAPSGEALPALVEAIWPDAGSPNAH